MEFSSPSPRLVLLFLSFIYLALLSNIAHSATIVVDGVSKWKDPTVQVGDSVIFEHKNDEYKLYIFQNKRAFDLCNFTQATLLINPNSTSYTWHPSRLGYFYFSFNNGTTKPCQEGQKLAIKVTMFQFENSAPPLGSAGTAFSSPSYSWPFHPWESTSPSPAPSSTQLPATSPKIFPRGEVPFIDSNPAVPLPTGEVDSATIGPLPISSNAHHTIVQVRRLNPQFQIAIHYCVLFLALL